MLGGMFMETQMQIFNHDDFGKLGVLMIDDKPYFQATKCAVALGYANPYAAVTKHCPHITKRKIAYQTIAANFIPESDLYCLMAHSNPAEAERFEKFIFGEVLPAIRKDGGYVTDDAPDKFIDNPEVIINSSASSKKSATRKRNRKDKLKRQKAKHSILTQFFRALRRFGSQLS